MKEKKVKTYFGFPVKEDAELFKGLSKQKGIALIIAVLAVSMMILFASDMILNSEVSLKLATMQRDNIKGEYMAKSASNLAIFLITADFGLDLFLAGPKSPMKKPASDGPEDIWNKLNGLPIGGATADMLSATISSFGLNAINDEETINTLKKFDGMFILNVEDEGGKINVNDCAEGKCLGVLTMLESLMSCPAEKVFLEDLNVTGKELTYRVKDWIDKDRKVSNESGLSNEDAPYEKMTPPYKSKNAPLDSLEELKLIDGWNNKIYSVFSPYITIYPFKKSTTSKYKVNINTASRELLGCLFPKAAVDCNNKFQSAFQTKIEEQTSFVSDPKNLNAFLEKILCYSKEDGVNSKNKKSNWLTTQSSVFRITAKGVIGDIERKLVVVIERVMPKAANKNKASYRILYWKLI